MKKLITSTLFLTVMLFGSMAFAGPGGYGHGKGFACGDTDFRASGLNLTEEQTGKLQALKENYLQEITPLKNREFALRSELRLLWSAENPDRDKIMAKQQEISGLKSQLAEKSTAYRLDFRALLTPEQQSKIAAAGPCLRDGHGRGWKHHRR